MSDTQPLTIENLMNAAYGGQIINGFIITSVDIEAILPNDPPMVRMPQTLIRERDGIRCIFHTKTCAR